MTIDASQVSDRNSNDRSSTLTDRVRAQVAEAGRLRDNRAPRANAKHKRLRPTRMTKSAALLTNNLEAQRELQSLRTVYREMRVLYRSYRRRAGTPPLSSRAPPTSSNAHLLKVSSFLLGCGSSSAHK